MEHESLTHEVYRWPDEISDYYAAVASGTYAEVRQKLQRLYYASIAGEAETYKYRSDELEPWFFTNYEVVNRIPLPSEEEFDARMSPAIEALSLIPIVAFGPNIEATASADAIKSWYMGSMALMIEAVAADHTLCTDQSPSLPGTCRNCDEAMQHAAYQTTQEQLRSGACPIMITRLHIQGALGVKKMITPSLVDEIVKDPTLSVSEQDVYALIDDMNRRDKDVAARAVNGRAQAGVTLGFISPREGDELVRKYVKMYEPLPEHLV